MVQTAKLLHLAVAPCALGQVMVAHSDQGLCAVALGDDPAPLWQAMRQRFAHATLAKNGCNVALSRVLAVIDRPHAAFDGPLDLQGTAFQHRVWQLLRQIPVGTTISYSDLAARLGAPTAVRAVAQACGANPVALVVPCHRVVRQNGELGGYRWGLARKKWLLAHEAHACNPIQAKA